MTKRVAGQRRYPQPANDEDDELLSNVDAAALAHYRGARRIRGLIWFLVAIPVFVVLLALVVVLAVMLGR